MDFTIPEDLKIMKTAAILTDKFYMEKTRLEELIFFAKKMDYQKLGLAFCIGLQNEAAIVDQIAMGVLASPQLRINTPVKNTP